MTGERLSENDFAAAFEDAFARLQLHIEATCAAQSDWPARVAVGIRAAFAFAFDDPETARLLTREALTRGGEQGQRHYQRMVSYFAALLLPGRALCADGNGPPAIAESAIAGGVVLLVGRQLERGREDQLPATAAEAVEFVLIPYIGIDQARRVASEHC